MAQHSSVFIFMGVCGSGKTTVASALQSEIEKKLKDTIKVSLIDGDDLHSKSNKSKMKQGIALTDRDRRPWLFAIRNRINRHNPLCTIDKHNKIRHILFVTCSALKYSYRQILRTNNKANAVSFIMLDASRRTLEKRLSDRQHEYMSDTLLESQLETLEYPNTKYIENDVIIQSVEGSLTQTTTALIDTIVRQKYIVHWRQTVRLASMVGEYNTWYINHHQPNITLCSAFMQLYSIEQCVDDFIAIHTSNPSKQMIRNRLNIDSTKRMLYDTASFHSIMSRYHQEEALYALTLHCILCYFGELDMIESDQMNELDPQLVAITHDHQELQSNLHLFNESERYAIKLLLQMNQSFMFKRWDKPNVNDAKKKELLAQILKLDAQYPGGLNMYYTNARRLLAASAQNVSPYSGWSVTSADNIAIEFGSDAFHKYEAIGRTQFGQCGFVLLGGGFGERLGFNGIKTGLPSEISTETSYIELYIKTLLAFQERASRDVLLPFACTTSGIGHHLTKQLLQDNAYFGLRMRDDEHCDQFTFLAQELVASFANNECEFALDEDYRVLEKPHGHGDVHSLMYQTGTAHKWHKNGIQWIICLQDTNAVAIRSLACALGVSFAHNFAMNSIATPRLKGESYGAICKLINNETHRALTINVEYNQLNALLGDTAPHPANTNTLIIRSDTYCEVLSKTKGMMSEFVNPKYVDPVKRDAFKKATRLECMMQDYPKLLFEQGYDENIGVTTLPKWMALQPVKKNIFDSQKDAIEHTQQMAEFCAANGESSVYFANRKYVQKCGVQLEGYNEMQLRMFNAINVKYGARIVLLPSFGVTLDEMKARFIGKDDIKITNNSTLILDGNVVIKKLNLNGTLVVKTGREYGDRTRIVIDGLTVHNKGWCFKEIQDLKDKSIDDVYKLRGYTLHKFDTKLIHFDDGQQHIISDI
eukprot:269290_1